MSQEQQELPAGVRESVNAQATVELDRTDVARICEQANFNVGVFGRSAKSLVRARIVDAEWDLLIKSRSNPHNFVARCREAGFGVKPLSSTRTGNDLRCPR